MSKNSTSHKETQEEIDLLYLFVALGDFIKRAFIALFNVLISFILFLIRGWYYFFGGIILTVLASLLLVSISDSYYYSDLVLKSNAVQNQIAMSYLKNIDDYAIELNHKSLAEELSLSIEDASSVRGLDTYWFYDIGDDEIIDGIDIEGIYLADTNAVIIEDRFLIRVKVTDPLVLKRFETGIVHYLESNPFFQESNIQRLADLEVLLTQTGYEIEKLDSLQKKEYYTNSNDLSLKEGQFLFSAENETELFHTEILNLLRAKQEYEKNLNIFYNVTTTIEGFSVPIKKDNGLTFYAKELIWYIMGLALFVAIVVRFRKKIWI